MIDKSHLKDLVSMSDVDQAKIELLLEIRAVLMFIALRQFAPGSDAASVDTNMGGLQAELTTIRARLGA